MCTRICVRVSICTCVRWRERGKLARVLACSLGSLTLFLDISRHIPSPYSRGQAGGPRDSEEALYPEKTRPCPPPLFSRYVGTPACFPPTRTTTYTPVFFRFTITSVFMERKKVRHPSFRRCSLCFALGKYFLFQYSHLPVSLLFSAGFAPFVLRRSGVHDLCGQRFGELRKSTHKKTKETKRTISQEWWSMFEGKGEARVLPPGSDCCN